VPNFQPAQPARFISGSTQNMPFQPLAGCGMQDPCWMAMWDDDFLPYRAGDYVVSGTGAAAASVSTGLGGVLQMTAAATIGDSTSIQLGGIGQFAVSSTNRLWWGARLALSAVPGPAMVAGLIAANTTPFTSISDGLYFNLPAASSTLSFISVVGGTATTVSLGSIFTPTAATFFDLAFVYQPWSELGSNIEIYAGVGLWGNKSGGQNSAPLGPIARLQPASITAVNLTPTLGVETSTATAYTLQADFHLAALER
jgi:hypothetical protein